MAQFKTSKKMGLLFFLIFGFCSRPCNARLGRTTTDLTASTFDAFVTEYNRVAVDFYDPKDESWAKDEKELEAALVAVRALGYENVPIAKVDARKEEELAKKYVRNGRYPQLIWFVHGKPTQYHRTLRSAKMITDFVNALYRPAITEVKSQAEAGAQYNRAVLAEIPKDPSSAVYKAVEAMAQRHMDMVGVNVLDSKKGTISWMNDGKVVSQYEGRTDDVDALDRWVKSQMPMRSESIPEGELAYEDNSRVVVGRNFEEVVFQQEKDVLLLVHATWCGYCKKLMPQWRKLATLLSKSPHLEVAMMDGDRNESPVPNDIWWHAYPTIFYVRASERDATIYRGDRSTDSLVKFVKDNTKYPADFENGSLPEADLDL